MSYNIFVETDKKIDWEKLNKKLYRPRTPIEYVPTKNIGIKAWEELKFAINIFQSEYKFDLYDMFYGEKIDDNLLSKIKTNIQL